MEKTIFEQVLSSIEGQSISIIDEHETAHGTFSLHRNNEGKVLTIDLILKSGINKYYGLHYVESIIIKSTKTILIMK